MISEGALRTDAIPKVKVTPDERKLIEERAEKLGFKKISQYVRYCINKEAEGK